MESAVIGRWHLRRGPDGIPCGWLPCHHRADAAARKGPREKHRPVATGHHRCSNLLLLQRFHFDYIKIDRQFVQNVVGDDYALVEAIRFVAGQVRALVIAEGVEEPKQQRALNEIGVRLAQGFLFARPGSATEFAQGYAATAGRAANIPSPPLRSSRPDNCGFDHLGLA